MDSVVDLFDCPPLEQAQDRRDNWKNPFLKTITKPAIFILSVAVISKKMGKQIKPVAP